MTKTASFIDTSWDIIKVDTSPNGSGTSAAMGAVGIDNVDPVGLYQKIGVNDTDWQNVRPSLFSQTATVTIASSAAEATLVGAGQGITTLPANFLSAGKMLRINAWGSIGSTATPTVIFKVKMGSTAVLTSSTFTLGAAYSSNGVWKFQGVLTCRTAGASGTVFAQGGAEAFLSASVKDSIPAVTTSAASIDTTATQAIDFLFTWGTSSASNTISCTNFFIEALN